MQHIVNWSGGLCSFWAGHRVVEKQGPRDVTFLFADTLIEDAELYDFNEEASALLGVPITRISRELSPWQLFRKEGLIGNSHFPICSIRLKREMLNQWMQTHYNLDRNQGNWFLKPATIVLGFDWNEDQRVKEFQNAHPTWRVESPMTEQPLWDKCKMDSEARKLGLHIPRLYTLGFPHNNCGGMCVAAGISHWVHLHSVMPDRYLEWEREEQETMEDFRTRGIEPMTMLKDRRGGTTQNLSLLQLRQRIEAGEKLPKFDWGGCGCGGAS